MATVNASIKGQPLVTATIKQAASLSATLKPAVTLTSSIVATGPQGPVGPAGEAGEAGAGIIAGGTANQVLSKINSTDYNTQWSTVDKTFVGLSNVDNTSDANKPVSTAAQTALDLKVTGPASATDNAIARFDGTTGKLIQNSSALVADSGKISTTIASGGNDEGFRVTQNDTTNNPRAATIVNAGTGYSLKIDHNGTAGDAVNIASSATDHTAFSVNAVNVSLSTIKIVNSAAQLTGSVATFWGTSASKTSDVLSVENAGTGQGIKVINTGDGMGVDVQTSATTKSALNADVVNTSGSPLRIKNTAAQTSNELALLWLSNSSSTAAGLNIVNEGTGNSLEIRRGGGLNARITNTGTVIGTLVAGTNGFINSSTANNSRLQLRTTGAVFDRNVADANPVLVAEQLHASGTGDLLQLKTTAGTKLSVSSSGAATFSDDVTVPDEVYGAGWNGSLEVPTKNAVYDKIETISAGGGVSEPLAIAYAIAL